MHSNIVGVDIFYHTLATPLGLSIVTQIDNNYFINDRKKFWRFWMGIKLYFVANISSNSNQLGDYTPFSERMHLGSDQNASG